MGLFLEKKERVRVRAGSFNQGESFIMEDGNAVCYMVVLKDELEEKDGRIPVFELLSSVIDYVDKDREVIPANFYFTPKEELDA